jgi:hypothetical protein
LRLKLFMLSVICLVMAPVLVSAADMPPKGPQAFLADGIYEFQPVVEGRAIVHAFILHNRGDAPLAILDLKSG